VLMSLGSFLAVLVITGDISLYLNSDLAWLTAVSAFFLWVLGGALFLFPRQRAGALRLGVYVAFLALCLAVRPTVMGVDDLLQLPF